MNHKIAPESMPPPAANYAHAILSEGTNRWLHTSGVVPIGHDLTVPESISDQALVVWENITALLAEAAMTVHDIVSVTTYVIVTEIASLPEVMEARDKALAGHIAASTLVTVPALTRPAWKMEIAVIACR